MIMMYRHEHPLAPAMADPLGRLPLGRAYHIEQTKFGEAMLNRLDGKVILLAGAGGVGDELARRYAREGASVLVGDIDGDAARRVVDEIVAAGGIAKAIQKIKPASPFLLKIEVEVSTLAEVQEALDNHADIIMLDNMSVEDMQKSVGLIQKKALVEASGNVSLENIRSIAATGVDCISTSAMFHSSRWADLSLLFAV